MTDSQQSQLSDKGQMMAVLRSLTPGAMGIRCFAPIGDKQRTAHMMDWPLLKGRRTMNCPTCEARIGFGISPLADMAVISRD